MALSSISHMVRLPTPKTFLKNFHEYNSSYFAVDNENTEEIKFEG